MPAMIMELAITTNDASRLQRGDRIEARLVVADGPGRLQDVRLVGHTEPEPAPPRRWDDSLLVGEILDPVEIETLDGPVRVGADQGHTTALAFLFIRCPVPEYCPLLASKLAVLQRQIAPARIVTVTLDPAHDTPERLAAYGTQVGADPSVWRLGRLPQPQLDALLAKVDVEVQRQQQPLSHNLRLLVLDPEGRLVHRERDNGWDVEALAETIRAASAPPGPTGARSGAPASPPR